MSQIAAKHTAHILSQLLVLLAFGYYELQRLCLSEKKGCLIITTLYLFEQEFTNRNCQKRQWPLIGDTDSVQVNTNVVMSIYIYKFINVLYVYTYISTKKYIYIYILISNIDGVEPPVRLELWQIYNFY